MPFQWAPEEYARLPGSVQQARELLEEWYWAMEHGTAKDRYPDPTYPVTITQEVADRVVEELDRGFDRELRIWASKPEAGGYEAGPEFRRLPPLQRIALAQQLHTILKRRSPRPGRPSGGMPEGTAESTGPCSW